MMKTGYEDTKTALEFGRTYVILHTPRPFDTTTQNYNWQIWGIKAFSLYTTTMETIDPSSSKQAVDAILNFLSKEGIIRFTGKEGYISRIIQSKDIISLRSGKAGFLEILKQVGEYVEKGEPIARILDTYSAHVLSESEITSPVDGTIGFSSSSPLIYENTTIFKIINDEDI